MANYILNGLLILVLVKQANRITDETIGARTVSVDLWSLKLTLVEGFWLDPKLLTCPLTSIQVLYVASCMLNIRQAVSDMTHVK